MRSAYMHQLVTKLLPYPDNSLVICVIAQVILHHVEVPSGHKSMMRPSLSRDRAEQQLVPVLLDSQFDAVALQVLTVLVEQIHMQRFQMMNPIRNKTQHTTSKVYVCVTAQL